MDLGGRVFGECPTAIFMRGGSLTWKTSPTPSCASPVRRNTRHSSTVITWAEGAAHCGRSYHPARPLRCQGIPASGPNVIGVMCHNRGVDSAYGPAKPAACSAQIDLVDLARSRSLVTEREWRVSLARELDRTSPRISARSGFQEVHDSRLKPVGWNVVGFDDSWLGDPEVVGEASADPWGVLIHRTIPCLEENNLLPVGVIVPESGTVRYPRSLLNASGDCATIIPGATRRLCSTSAERLSGFPEIERVGRREWSRWTSATRRP